MSEPELGKPRADREDGGRWGSLLAGLTAEELRQYSAMARDQILKENRWGVLHLVLLLGSLAAFGSVVRDMLKSGLAADQLYGLLLAAFLFYWPYRSLKTKRLWRGHRAAVDKELARRGMPHVHDDKEQAGSQRRSPSDGEDDT